MNAAQVNARIDADLKARFKLAVQRNHDDQNTALAKMIEAYTESADEHSVRHLDGSLCPLAELLRALRDKVREMKP